MGDNVMTAMIVPSNQIQYSARDGTVYRGDANSNVDVELGHVAEMTATWGFTLATNATVDTGDDLQLDQGWDPTA